MILIRFLVIIDLLISSYLRINQNGLNIILKIEHSSQIGVMEIFLEATPTTFLLVVLIISGLKSYSEEGLLQLLWGNGEGPDFALFIISC